jgi:hypothetical protein
MVRSSTSRTRGRDAARHRRATVRSGVGSGDPHRRLEEVLSWQLRIRRATMAWPSSCGSSRRRASRMTSSSTSRRTPRCSATPRGRRDDPRGPRQATGAIRAACARCRRGSRTARDASPRAAARLLGVRSRDADQRRRSACSRARANAYEGLTWGVAPSLRLPRSSRGGHDAYLAGGLARWVGGTHVTSATRGA